MVVIRVWDGVKGVHGNPRGSKILLQSVVKTKGTLVSIQPLDGVAAAIVRLGNRVVLP
jgi:hypothetical protein